MPDVSIPPTRGYLAVPVGPGPRPGVVVIHEAFGLNSDTRSAGGRLAAEGYLALAPDLYAGVPWVRCLRCACRQSRALRAGSTRWIPARDLVANRAEQHRKTGVQVLHGRRVRDGVCAPWRVLRGVGHAEVPKDAEEALAGSVRGREHGDKAQMGTAPPEAARGGPTSLNVQRDLKGFPGAAHRSYRNPPLPRR